jgi:cytoskeletal protein CcmA (bactofilin family)
MFGRAKNHGNSRAAAGAASTVLGQGSRWQGEIHMGPHSLRVEGEVEGTIQSEGHVTVAEGGLVRGAIHAKRLTVMGRAEGVFKVEGCLEILGKGWVEGEVHLGTLVVDEGGTLMGSCTRQSDPPPPVEREPVPLVPRRDERTLDRVDRFGHTASGTHDFLPPGRGTDRRF